MKFEVVDEINYFMEGFGDFSKNYVSLKNEEASFFMHP